MNRFFGQSFVNELLGVVLLSKMAKTVSVVGFVVMTIAGSRLLYLFISRDSQGFSLGGINGLWVSIGVTVISCIAGGLMFYSFLHHDRDMLSQTVRDPIQPATQSLGIDLTQTATSKTFDLIAWEKLNPWLIEGQADDRMPMLGSAGVNNGSASVRRSTARRTHQRMFKEWSQARHDY